MGCFRASCFGHKHTMKKVQHQPLSPSHQRHEAVTLEAAATEALKEDNIVFINPILKSNQEANISSSIVKGNGEEEQMNRSNENVATGVNEQTGSNDDKLLKNENGQVGENCKDDDGSSQIPPYPSSNHDHQECVDVLNSKEVSLAADSCSRLVVDEEEETSESLFSLSIDSRKQVFGADIGDKEVSSPLKPCCSSDNNRKIIVHFLMNPSSIEEENSNNKENVNPTTRDNDTTIISLSSWLNTSSSPQKTSVVNSPESEKNYQQLNHGDDEQDIGTVGRYWRQKGLVA